MKPQELNFIKKATFNMKQVIMNIGGVHMSIYDQTDVILTEEMWKDIGSHLIYCLFMIHGTTSAIPDTNHVLTFKTDVKDEGLHSYKIVKIEHVLDFEQEVKAAYMINFEVVKL